MCNTGAVVVIVPGIVEPLGAAGDPIEGLKKGKLLVPLPGNKRHGFGPL